MQNRSVSIVGTGNMAESLIRTFLKNQISIDLLIGRNESRLKELSNAFGVRTTKDKGLISKESLVILAVPDDQIAQVSEELSSDLEVAHTSGSVSIDCIQQNVKGVFYPLQTMTKGREVEFDQIPILIESNSELFRKSLEHLAKQNSQNVLDVDSMKRRKIHLAAVILNNFTTQLNIISQDYLESIGVDTDLLNPLLKETTNKIEEIGPRNSLTGPAKRGDSKTIEEHLSMLDGDLKALYLMLSNIILKENGKL